jgi:hypothetical protein
VNRERFERGELKRGRGELVRGGIELGRGVGELEAAELSFERTRTSRIREASYRKDWLYCGLTKGRDGSPAPSCFWRLDGCTIVPGPVRRTDTLRRGMEVDRSHTGVVGHCEAWERSVPILEWLGTVCLSGSRSLASEGDRGRAARLRSYEVEPGGRTPDSCKTELGGRET